MLFEEVVDDHKRQINNDKMSQLHEKCLIIWSPVLPVFHIAQSASFNFHPKFLSGCVEGQWLEWPET